ncbi:MAG: hypothetical protein ACK54L_09875, partial [Betaproteobacteria bacterium]
MIVLLTFYAGELVWRERQLRADQVADATPVPTAAVAAVAAASTATGAAPEAAPPAAGAGACAWARISVSA